jgi:hypothetical protein
LETGTIVAQFEGPIVDRYDQVPYHIRSHALVFKADPSTVPDPDPDPPGYKWLITMSDAGLIKIAARQT